MRTSASLPTRPTPLLLTCLLLLLSLLLLHLVPLVRAQDVDSPTNNNTDPTDPTDPTLTAGPTPSPSTTPRPGSELKPTKFDSSRINTHFFWSSDSPLSSVFLDPSRPLLPSYRTLIDFVSHIDESVVNATLIADQIRSGNTSDDGAIPELPDDLLVTCRRRNDGWEKSVVSYFIERGFDPPDLTCVTDVDGVNEDNNIANIYYARLSREPPTIPQMFHNVMRHGSLVAEHALDAASAANVANWTQDLSEDVSVTRATNFLYNEGSQSCRHDYIGFVKIDAAWRLAERITNAAADVVMEQGKRNFLHEFIAPGKDPATMRLVDRNDSQRTNIWNATTVMESTIGSVQGSAFGPIASPDNLAVQRAIHRGDHQTQQASDATTVSNIAILAFPLVMNIVPVALIADVNSFGMLVYTLLTDVLTAVPLAIKGVEVLTIGHLTTHAVFTRISGADIDQPDVVKVAELWVAECQADDSFRATGIILLTIALTFMAGGIIAEFWAKWFTTRKGAGMVVDHSWAGAAEDVVDANEPISNATTSMGPNSLGANSLGAAGSSTAVGVAVSSRRDVVTGGVGTDSGVVVELGDGDGAGAGPSVVSGASAGSKEKRY